MEIQKRFGKTVILDMLLFSCKCVCGWDINTTANWYVVVAQPVTVRLDPKVYNVLNQHSIGTVLGIVGNIKTGKLVDTLLISSIILKTFQSVYCLPVNISVSNGRCAGMGGSVRPPLLDGHVDWWIHLAPLGHVTGHLQQDWQDRQRHDHPLLCAQALDSGSKGKF